MCVCVFVCVGVCVCVCVCVRVCVCGGGGGGVRCGVCVGGGRVLGEVFAWSFANSACLCKRAANINVQPMQTCSQFKRAANSNMQPIQTCK
jgi:hypothetical protein